MRRGQRSLVHFVAECRVCGWRTEDYIKGPKQAAGHAARTGHRVVGDAGYMVEYGRRRQSSR